jgi:uncharacterized membrane protein YgdD (TMEM256/DUF423 family)
MHRKVDSVEGEMILALGATLAGLGVAAGAFGAHLLTERLTSKELDIWRTAASYQMYHALALIVVGRLLTRHASRLLRASCWLFISGILFFSGSLYLLAISGQTAFGSLTPIGGAAFLGGWGCLAVSVARSGRS